MAQQPLEESRSLVDIMRARDSEIASKIPPGVSSPSRPYSVEGPHGQVRTMLMWVNKLLAYDVNGSVSAISVRELRLALIAFQKDVRAQGMALGVVNATATEGSSRSRSSTPTNRRSSIKEKTRNFKN